jgi:hypothetical protein
MTNSDIDLPKYTDKAELGEKGVRMIADVVEDELHWIFRPITKTDVGIDGEIEYVTEDRKSTGKLMAVQIKCGPSFFEEKTNRGYIFRCRTETVNYWLSLSIPVILCLCNNITKKIYWCHITVETIQKLKVNYKVEIPYENVINKNNKFKLKRVLESVIPIQSVVDTAIFIHLHERFKKNMKICPIMEEPRDFHNLSYIIELKDELCIVGTVIDRYGYFNEKELLEKICLYKENRISCGWEQCGVESKFMIFFVSESAKNLKLPKNIMKILLDYKSDITYERLLLSKEFISATLISENGDEALIYDENGTGEFESFGNNAFNRME